MLGNWCSNVDNIYNHIHFLSLTCPLNLKMTVKCFTWQTYLWYRQYNKKGMGNYQVHIFYWYDPYIHPTWGQWYNDKYRTAIKLSFGWSKKRTESKKIIATAICPYDFLLAYNAVSTLIHLHWHKSLFVFVGQYTIHCRVCVFVVDSLLKNAYEQHISSLFVHKRSRL